MAQHQTIGQTPEGSSQLHDLRSYDPALIARYFQRRPWQVIRRSVTVAWTLCTFLLALQWDRWFDATAGHKQERAAQLRHILTDLGPTFIKVGQALSTRPDLVRKDFLEELVKLQDQLPPFANDIAFKLIETELQRPVSAIFKEITPDPIAAASLGQVYKAVLHSGETVAVKVQRPNLVPRLTLDLYLIRMGATWLGPFLPLNLGHDLALIVDEFGTKLFEEIDYINEGRNAERFAHNFRNNLQVKVPSIYWRYTSKRVLTLEWIQGLKLTGVQHLEAAKVRPDDVVYIGVTSGLQQLMEFGFFHADPHPGNLFAIPANPSTNQPCQMAYIDFGMMDQLEQEAKETLVDAVVHLINKDYTDLAQDFVKLGFLAPDTDIYPIVPALESVLGDIMGESVRDFNFKVVTDRFSELMFEYPFRVPAKFALIIRSIVTQEGLALSVNPDFKIVEVAYPYVAKRLLTGETPALRRRLLEVLFKDGKFHWDRLENMIRIARSDGQFDLLPTAQLGLQYLMSEEGLYLRQKLLLALTEDDRLHTAEVQRLWDLLKDDLQPSKLMSTAWDAFTDFSREQAANFLPTGLVPSKL
ncbi:MAG: ABC1 kinase family protein [Prochlorothrix sp.]|nr:AarF/ABC1/UbiB kinase family protein [Prochlorothrix sp.]